MNKYKYIFGPVHSRRFGRSLGVDLVPLKTCTMDCVFCQLGHTARSTIVRKEYVPVELVNAEIADWLKSGEPVDCITLSGSGEPTLHSRFGDVIHFIHKTTTTPVLLLTNSSLLHMAPVRRAASRADIVKVSLSAWDQESFERINHPCPGLTFERYIAGLVAFRAEFKGQLVMEVFLVRGVNADKDAAEKISALVKLIKPDRVQFNTAVRPPADRSVLPVTSSRMKVLAKMFSPRAELIPSMAPGKGTAIKATGDEILALLRRHPCTISQVAKAFRMPVLNAKTTIESLLRNRKVAIRRVKDKVYYTEQM